MNYEVDSMKKLTMFIVSDSVGETAELVAKAAASQFRQGLETVSMKKFSMLRMKHSYKKLHFLHKESKQL